jgi:hypothetical protein
MPPIVTPTPLRMSWLAANHRKIVVALTLFVVSEILAWIVAVGYGHWSLGEGLDLRSYCQWDCGWYGSIIDNGYQTGHPAGDQTNWAFFPLFPLLAGSLGRLIGLGHPEALVVTGSLLLPVCIFLFIAFIDAEGIALDPWLAGSLVAFNPWSVYAHTGYTEPLYFALCTGALLALRGDRWLAAGLLGAACSASRLVGVFLILPMAGRLVAHRGGKLPLEALLGMALVPLGLALFGWHLYGRTGDMLAFIHIQAAWGHTPRNPAGVWWEAMTHGVGYAILALVAAWALCGAIYLSCRGRIAYGAFLAVATLLPLSLTVISMPRYVFWQPVFLLALADVLRRWPRLRLLLPMFWLGSIVMNAVWLSRHGFAM